MSSSIKRLSFLSLLVILFAFFSHAAYAQTGVATRTGGLADGATYVI